MFWRVILRRNIFQRCVLVGWVVEELVNFGVVVFDVVVNQDGDLLLRVVELGDLLQELSQKWRWMLNENGNDHIWPFVGLEVWK